MKLAFCCLGSKYYNAKDSQGDTLTVFCRADASSVALTFRGSRQKRSASCGHGHDGKPIHDGHSLWPFSHGSHACSHGDGCAAEMFFSLSYSCFILLFLCAKEGILSLTDCKITHKIRTDKELCYFFASILMFFSEIVVTLHAYFETWHEQVQELRKKNKHYTTQ